MWQVSWFTAAEATFWICMHKHADSQEVQLLLPVMWHSMLFWQKKMRFFWECLLGRNNIIVLLYSVSVILDYINILMQCRKNIFFFFLHLWYKISRHSLYFALVSHLWSDCLCRCSCHLCHPHHQMPSQVVQPCNDLILTQSQQHKQEL